MGLSGNRFTRNQVCGTIPPRCLHANDLLQTVAPNYHRCRMRWLWTTFLTNRDARLLNQMPIFCNAVEKTFSVTSLTTSTGICFGILSYDSKPIKFVTLRKSTRLFLKKLIIAISIHQQWDYVSSIAYNNLAAIWWKAFEAIW